MELYLVVCVCVSILALFSVGESLFKKLNVSRYFVAIFLMISALSFYISPFDFAGLTINVNFCLYALLFVFVLFKQKSFKNFLRSVLIACICLAICVCYNSLNLLQYEFAYFQPYLLICLLLGIVCCLFSSDIKTCFLGLFIGVSVSELIRSNNIMFVQNEFILGQMQFCCLIAITLLCFSALVAVKGFAITIKQKYKTNKTN